jgi:hypothetical protein
VRHALRAAELFEAYNKGLSFVFTSDFPWSATGALGLARRDGNRRYNDGGLGPAKPEPERPEHPGRAALREELVEEGELVPVTVEGVRGKRFVLRQEVELLKAPPGPPLSVCLNGPTVRRG